MGDLDRAVDSEWKDLQVDETALSNTLNQDIYLKGAINHYGYFDEEYHPEKTINFRAKLTGIYFIDTTFSQTDRSLISKYGNMGAEFLFRDDENDLDLYFSLKDGYPSLMQSSFQLNLLNQDIDRGRFVTERGVRGQITLPIRGGDLVRLYKQAKPLDWESI